MGAQGATGTSDSSTLILNTTPRGTQNKQAHPPKVQEKQGPEPLSYPLEEKPCPFRPTGPINTSQGWTEGHTEAT